RITNNDKGFRLHKAASLCPKIFVIVERRAIADGSAVQLSRHGGSNDNDGDSNGDSAPGRGRNRALKFQRRTAVNLFLPRRFAEEQARQPKPFFKTGNR